MAGEYTISILLKAQDLASSIFQKFSGVLNGIVPGLGTIASAALGVGGAVVGVGIKAVSMAANFQESMTSLVTGAGKSQKNIGMVSNGILNMAVQTGETTQQLSQGLYMIESASYHGAAGLQVLQAATQGSLVGSARLQDVAFTLTGVLHDYKLSASSAVPAMNALIATTQAGKMHMQDLSLALGNVLPVAAKLKVSYPQIGGAIAAMTNSNTTAQRATQNLNNALLAMSAPSKTGMKAMSLVGLSAQQLSDTLSKQGLSGALQLVEKHVGEKFPASSVAYKQALKAIMGGTTGYKVAMMLTGQNLKEFEHNVTSISSAMHGGTKNVTGWALVQGDLNTKIAQAKEVVETLMIRIGTALVPVVTKLFGAIMPLVTSFSNWITKSGILQQVANGLTHAIMPVVAGFTKWLSSGKNLQGGLSQVGLVIKQVGSFVLDNLVKPIGALVGAILGVLVPLGTWLVKSGALHTILVIVGTTIAIVVKAIGGILSAAAGVINFFSHSQVAATSLLIPLGALGGYLVFLAVQAIVSFLATLPELLAGFGLWAFGAGAAAAATLLAAAPFILVGIAIAAIIVIIILLVKHWGAVIAFLRGAWQAFSSWFNAALHAVGNFISSIWNGIVHFFVTVWTDIVSFVKAHALLLLAVITGPIGAIVILIVTHWTQIKQFLAAAWAWVVNTAKGLWNDVTGVFRNAWSGISSAVQSLWHNLVAFVSGWRSQALAWGRDLIQNLINGILGMIGNLGSAVGQVASKIASFLHFSKPEAGPLASVMSWMPDFGTLLAAGLAAQKGKLHAAVTTMVQPMAGAVRGASGAPTGSSGAPVVSAGGGQTTVINNYVNYTGTGKWTQADADALAKLFEHKQRMSGQQVKTASGRRY